MEYIRTMLPMRPMHCYGGRSATREVSVRTACLAPWLLGIAETVQKPDEFVPSKVFRLAHEPINQFITPTHTDSPYQRVYWQTGKSLQLNLVAIEKFSKNSYWRELALNSVCQPPRQSPISRRFRINLLMGTSHTRAIPVLLALTSRPDPLRSAISARFDHRWVRLHKGTKSAIGYNISIICWNFFYLSRRSRRHRKLMPEKVYCG